MKKWTKEEESFLVDNYRELSIEEIMKVIPRSKDAIRWRAKALGITRSRGESWTDKEIKMIEENYSISEICRMTGRTYTSVVKKRRIIENRDKSKKINKLSGFFDKTPIEKGIPNMNIYSKSSQYFYLLSQMEIGDSFEYPQEEHSLLRNQMILFEGKKFQTKRWIEGSRRVWRIK
ncbi:hypothetical protein [Riemerella columbipharyngis]|uniref:Uncharacterized protein n=1 Tax=Riemerella columbipharyngis TaxID=1071918 RepID=A0A1G7FYF1_9FLAO|nr:hypothetical protein [Riemerella columbipharyngis]SDE80897.1 hypothetical protein SAMN05421544_1326 [Riemerella columbipharyngis]